MRHFNDIITIGHIRTESTNAFMKVFPKPGKDPLNPGSYRPISRIDIDQKLLTKIMADRLALILPSRVGPSQRGFVKGRSAIGKICKVLTVLDRVKHQPVPSKHPALLALHTEKAFDNVSWGWS